MHKAIAGYIVALGYEYAYLMATRETGLVYEVAMPLLDLSLLSTKYGIPLENRPDLEGGLKKLAKQAGQEELIGQNRLNDAEGQGARAHDVSAPRSARVFILLEEIVREDAFTLYGFCAPLSRDIFRRLLKVNGIGAKIALAVLSRFSADELLGILRDNDIKRLTKVSGLGNKGATRILLELNDFKEDIIDAAFEQNEGRAPASKEARQAKKTTKLGEKEGQIVAGLLNYGFKEGQIKDALRRLEDELETLELAACLRLVLQNING